MCLRGMVREQNEKTHKCWFTPQMQMPSMAVAGTAQTTQSTFFHKRANTTCPPRMHAMIENGTRT